MKEINNLKIESVITKVSTKHGKIIRRKYHTFNIRVSGQMKYHFGDKTVTVNTGEVIFLPKGSTYDYCVESVGESVCTIINLDADFGDCNPSVYPLDEIYCSEYLMHSISDSWNFGTAADRYKCLSHVYDLLSYISNYELLNYPEKKKLRLIEPAVEYLKNHIYDTGLKIDELPLMCGISGTYFREIFMMKFSTSPKNYITEKRLSRAKAIIDSGDFQTVKQLAVSVGFEDSLYFSKVFKKHYGLPPATLNKIE